MTNVMCIHMKDGLVLIGYWATTVCPRPESDTYTRCRPSVGRVENKEMRSIQGRMYGAYEKETYL